MELMLFLIAYAVVFFIIGYLYAYDRAIYRTFLVMSNRLTEYAKSKKIYKNIESKINSWWTEKGNCCIGVGDGSGDHFVYGKYETVKILQGKLLELERLRRIVKSNQSEMESLNSMKRY